MYHCKRDYAKIGSARSNDSVVRRGRSSVRELGGKSSRLLTGTCSEKLGLSPLVIFSHDSEVECIYITLRDKVAGVTVQYDKLGLG